MAKIAPKKHPEKPWSLLEVDLWENVDEEAERANLQQQLQSLTEEGRHKFRTCYNPFVVSNVLKLSDFESQNQMRKNRWNEKVLVITSTQEKDRKGAWKHLWLLESSILLARKNPLREMVDRIRSWKPHKSGAQILGNEMGKNGEIDRTRPLWEHILVEKPGLKLHDSWALVLFNPAIHHGFRGKGWQ